MEKCAVCGKDKDHTQSKDEDHSDESYNDRDSHELQHDDDSCTTDKTDSGGPRSHDDDGSSPKR